MRTPFFHKLHDYFFPHKRNNYRPHLFSIASIAALVAVVIVFEAGYLVQTKLVFLKTDFLASVLPGALVALTNQDRLANGLAGVTESPLLDRAAQAVAEDMAAKGYFAHVSPDGKSPWQWLDQVGYRYSYAGENLAVNFTDSSAVEAAWMNSPMHRANIERPQYTQVGFGTANGMYEGNETTFVAEFFATPAAVVQAAPTAPVRVALAKPSPAAPVVTAAPQVLGSQTNAAPAPAVAEAAPRTTNWLTSLLVSPFSTIESILAALFAAIAALFVIALIAHGRLQHPRLVFGGVFLLLFISGAMLASAAFAGSVLLPAGGQAASVSMGVAP
ncbi:MAG TPA: CAP domain-containing protein [Candidatus Paceibacterota bacterium]|nr:CAP domain-containing protein [Candidatus Paceibacterota bacterium]